MTDKTLLTRSPFGGTKPKGKAAPKADFLLPSRDALKLLTDKPPADQRIMDFGRLTPIGKRRRGSQEG